MRAREAVWDTRQQLSLASYNNICSAPGAGPLYLWRQH